MKKIRYLLLLLCVLLYSHVAKSATFKMYLTHSGNCGGIEGGTILATVEALFNHYVNQAASGLSPTDCEILRNTVQNELNYTSGGCTVRVICGPCTGYGDGAGGTSSANILGPTNGSSFFSANAANEVRDWDANADRLKQMLTGGTSSTLMPDDAWTASVYQDAEAWMAGGGARTEDEARSGSPAKAKFFTIDTSKDFVSLNMRDDRGMIPIAREPYVDYVKFEALLALNSNYNDLDFELRKLFSEECGLSLTELAELKKKPQDQLTENEKQILAYYEQYMDNAWAYLKKLGTDNPAKKEIDASILAWAGYDDSEKKYKKEYDKYLEKIGYERIIADQIPNTDPFYPVAQILNALDNKQNANTLNWQELMKLGPAIGPLKALVDKIQTDATDQGFDVTIFRNKDTGEYTISFQGTNDTSDVITDISQGLFGNNSRQFEIAKNIGLALSLLPEDCKVNITGHSLGGALASIASLVSGKPAITVNAMGVPRDWMESHGLLEKYNNHDYQITALISANDLLNHAQKVAENSKFIFSGPGTAIGNQKILGESSVTQLINAYSNEGRILAEGLKQSMERLPEAPDIFRQEAISGIVTQFVPGGPVTEAGVSTLMSADNVQDAPATFAGNVFENLVLHYGIKAVAAASPVGAGATATEVAVSTVGIPIIKAGAHVAKPVTTAVIEVGKDRLTNDAFNLQRNLKKGVSLHGSIGVARFVTANNYQAQIYSDHWRAIQKSKPKTKE